MFLMWLLFYLKEQGLFYILIMCETTKFLGYQWCIFFLWIPLPSPVPNYFWSQPEHPLDSIRYTYMTVPYKKDIYFCQFQVYKNKFRLWIQNKPHIKLAISYFLVRGGRGGRGVGVAEGALYARPPRSDSALLPPPPHSEIMSSRHANSSGFVMFSLKPLVYLPFSLVNLIFSSRFMICISTFHL